MDSLLDELVVEIITWCDYTTIRVMRCVGNRYLRLIDNRFWEKYKTRISLSDVVREDIPELSE